MCSQNVQEWRPLSKELHPCISPLMTYLFPPPPHGGRQAEQKGLGRRGRRTACRCCQGRQPLLLAKKCCIKAEGREDHQAGGGGMPSVGAIGSLMQHGAACTVARVQQVWPAVATLTLSYLSAIFPLPLPLAKMSENLTDSNLTRRALAGTGDGGLASRAMGSRCG
jgi:hypothetical protein